MKTNDLQNTIETLNTLLEKASVIGVELSVSNSVFYVSIMTKDERTYNLHSSLSEVKDERD